METTTIQISKKLAKVLNKLRLYPRETYEEIIWSLLEGEMELSEEVKKEIKQAEEEFKSGEVVSHEQLKKEFS